MRNRAQRLLQAAETLAECENLEEVLSTVLRSVVPEFADRVELYLGTPDGAFHARDSGKSEPVSPDVARRLLAEIGKPRQPVRDRAPEGRRWTAPIRVGGQPWGLLRTTESLSRPERISLTSAEELAALTGISIGIAWWGDRLHRKEVRVRDEFMIVVSHELRTPLTVLKLQLHSLRKTLSHAITLGQSELALRTAAQLENQVERQLSRLEVMTENVIEATRANSGSLRMIRQEEDLASVVKAVLERQAPDLASARCELNARIEGPIPGMWDSRRIGEVLTNLLLNATKYGGGRPIDVTLAREGDFARLSVRDHGIGIEKQEQERIFGRFERAVSPVNFSGIGFGLYVARCIAKAHGGEIEVTSRPGMGSTFVVTLPVMPPVASLATGQSQR